MCGSSILLVLDGIWPEICILYLVCVLVRASWLALVAALVSMIMCPGMCFSVCVCARVFVWRVCFGLYNCVVIQMWSASGCLGPVRVVVASLGSCRAPSRWQPC